MSYIRPCPFCGELSFTWGELREYKDITFKEDGSSKFLILYGLNRGDHINARRCNGCGNVQLFTKVPYLPKQEGKQKRQHSLSKKEDDYWE
jgi:hypothetical protein